MSVNRDIYVHRGECGIFLHVNVLISVSFHIHVPICIIIYTDAYLSDFLLYYATTFRDGLSSQSVKSLEQRLSPYMLMHFSGQLEHDPLQRSLSITTIRKKGIFLMHLCLKSPIIFQEFMCISQFNSTHKIGYRYFKRFMYHTFVHNILPEQKHLLSLVQLHTYMIQGHYCTCKVRYSNFLAMKMVAFRASCHRNICLS